MRFARATTIMALVVLMAVAAAVASAQNNETTAAPSSGSPAQGRELSIYGEVQSVDTAANSMKVQYYDYDADDEKTAEVVVNSDTKLENANALSDVKKTDWVDVTYTVVEGKNIAKLVSVEREEEAPAAPAPSAAPADMGDE